MIRDLHYLKAMGYSFLKDFPYKNEYNISFANLNNNVKQCTLCHFSKNRKNSLMEKVQKKVNLMILTSHGDKSENESGILLNSHKGSLLKEYLKLYLNLEEKDFYFSYLFKCFDYRKNDDFSLQSCLPFFYNELNLIKPKILLCLGEYAFQSLGLKDFNILRGEIFSYKNFFILPSFELDFIEKNPSYEQKFIEDLKKLKGFL
ncbi:uracil-DNA glycosylase family protein [Campylobacter sp. TTU-622]|uniref:uracil-DNA glycosylase family protein n=1 Tax=unclassified Campylobacter TaxID=2593542 RepID=UPI0019079F14|nr:MULTISPECIES: uracil-DNA glycosylase family protein [unclassified Campylobacter]MBK1971163.1 uracil-DNA glycosylase family protein [Campylobacter sp. TTU_617]MBK1974023.1 uracil-DNA glycosylase family protein [Campylobacter sp. TTU-622]MBK1991578.1 uracil-DNA glycosylase family protein [Campylobacter sp. 2018MI34]